MAEKEKRIGSTPSTSQTIAPPPFIKEWPAIPKETIEVPDGNGGVQTIKYTDFLIRMRNNNRGGT